jgi:parallel beta-helix repeat protein
MKNTIGPSSIRLMTVAVSLLLQLSAAKADTVSVSLKPGDDIQSIVDAHSPGTLYIFQPGIYRMQAIVPKTGDVFDGGRAAVLNGSRLLTKFERVGGIWAASDQTPQGHRLLGRPCQRGFPRCDRPEDLYLDDKPLHHVDRMYDVVPGKWFFDYATHTVYLGDDPTGRKVEIGVTARAFGGKASNVVVRNLTVEKYATPISAIDSEYGSAWLIENNVVQLNHAVGVNAGSNTKIIRNRIVRNGQQGFDGGGKNYLFEGNEIAHNNYAGVNYEWEAGGGKVTETQDAVIRGNCVHDNDGPGIWADENVRRLTIENNVVFNNSANGIMYEISYDGIIRNNVVADNGKGFFRWFWGPQILVAGSSNVQVYGNRIDVPAEYGSAITIVAQNRSPHPPATGNEVFNNTIVMRGTRARMGLGTDVPAYVPIVAAKNSMRQNEYHVVNLTTAFWHWNNRDLNWSQVASEHQEAGSTIDNVLPPKPKLDCAFLGLN